jgi:hypothetical protein
MGRTGSVRSDKRLSERVRLGCVGDGLKRGINAPPGPASPQRGAFVCAALRTRLPVLAQHLVVHDVDPRGVEAHGDCG